MTSDELQLVMDIQAKMVARVELLEARIAQLEASEYKSPWHQPMWLKQDDWKIPPTWC